MNGTLRFALGFVLMLGGLASVGAAVLNDFAGPRRPGLRSSPLFLGLLGAALILAGAVLAAD